MESSSRNVVITNGTDTVVLKLGETSATLPAGDYTLTNDDTKITVRFHLLLLQKQAVKNHQVQQLLQKQLQQLKLQLKQQLRLLQRPQLFQVTMLQWVLMNGIQLL